MKPMTSIQAKIFGAGYTDGPFSYYNRTYKENRTVVIYRESGKRRKAKSNRSGGEIMFIEQPAHKTFESIAQTETTNYILNRVPLLSTEQSEIIATAIREMLR